MTHMTNYSEPDIPWDNCDMNNTWEPEMRPFVNELQFKMELLKRERIRERNQMYRNNNYSRIEYGTSDMSYCRRRRHM
ncbi:Protein CBG26469 [Caenorhabditis briggsae]|uniref:Protein CBG26469 n=1 Tax=Caenorhabditis briggsae TaxID=6238 RepID=B6IFR6_CAEBR|nr:Protein CBG26469 [Caenorhabditis briggsae]CAR98746.1 Protein CBG26469 [Caenorhabditis briggsae]